MGNMTSFFFPFGSLSNAYPRRLSIIDRVRWRGRFKTEFLYLYHCSELFR